ncbi:hypothetical protein [Desulfonatronum thiodismutans]|uniref:hypothetical protein n=1 Tax=Desulfonatronum thiodismutans TaxID=159290 RepID=UPI0004ABEE76|nr:hypothetical protein [Desulfonatronum thiodismutans]
MTMTATDLPLEAQERLLDFAEHLPETKRFLFIKNVAERVGDLAKNHPRTIIFSALGWVLGEMVDNPTFWVAACLVTIYAL